VIEACVMIKSQQLAKNVKSTYRNLSTALLLLFLASSVSAAVRYVDVNNANPVLPYTDWATAAANIQDAVDAASAGDQILVTNGVYETGGRSVGTNLLANRVAVTKPVVVQSVNGPRVTVIRGASAFEWGGPMRCVYLTNGAVLAGFTLANGQVYSFPVAGGGVWCESVTATVSNCIVIGNLGGGGGGGAYGGTLMDCTINNNSANSGGGAENSILNNCTLSGNWTDNSGGGAESCILNHCTLTGNSARLGGGGASDSTLNFCTLDGNLAYAIEKFGGFGGGAASSTLNNCTIRSNSAAGGWWEADGYGGGAADCIVNNCTLSGNSAGSGGGAAFGTLNSCTLTENSASRGGGAYAGAMNNCILFYNNASVDSNYHQDPFDGSPNYCCTMPMPTNGIGNFTNSPLFIDATNGDFRLQPNSPCINAGANNYVTTSTDLDGKPRISGTTVDVGAYEFVFTPSTQLAQLIRLVEQANLGRKNKTPLLATLAAAMTALDRGNVVAACNQLAAFADKARAQVMPVDFDLAREFIAAAERIVPAAQTP